MGWIFVRKNLNQSLFTPITIAVIIKTVVKLDNYSKAKNAKTATTTMMMMTTTLTIVTV